MSTNDTPTTDRFGHRVPTSEEIEGDREDDDESEQDAIEAEMRIRAMRFYNER